MRCLQDPNYARRGIGRHTLALLHHAPAGLRLEGLTDPGLPPLLEEAYSRLSTLHPNAYAAMAEPPDSFVSLSPMTHDPIYVARALSDERVRRVAVVYDFIPRREPARYLPSVADRLGYAVALRWLARHTLFTPISHVAADALISLLNIPSGRVAVTGAPVEEMFERARDVCAGRPPRHLLVVGGDDPRKNPEVVIRAHARSATLQTAGIPLVVAGNYDPTAAEAFRELARGLGGRPALINVPGHLPEAALLEIYALAWAIICPSRNEGFSLPVVEGMAAGLPCLASDIPAQRELVVDPALRFEPDDVATLTPMLERIVADPRWRSNILHEQALIWPRFRAREVGRRFWDALLARADGGVRAAPAVLHGAKPRVALLSPMPPDRSGVADYTRATCGPLSEFVDLHVFTEAADPAPLPNVASVRPLGAIPHLAPGFDRVVSVMGNSHFHLRIFEYLMRYGGACIAHDARMLGFYAILLGAERAKTVASRELRRPVADTELQSWVSNESGMKTLFLGEIAASAKPMIVHSSVTRLLVQKRYDVVPAYLPFSIYRPWSKAELTHGRRDEARKRLGLENGEVAIATFGFVHGTKAPEECVWALEMLRGWGFPASLHFVGSTETLEDGGSGLRAVVARLGLSDHVRFTGGDYVPEKTYRDYLVGADLAIQVRTFGFGSLSGALLDCAAAGLPTLTNETLRDAVGVPEGYVRAVPDSLSPVLMAEALAELLEKRRLDPSKLEAERAAYSDTRSFNAYARGLCEVLGLELEVSRRSAAQ